MLNRDSVRLSVVSGTEDDGRCSNGVVHGNSLVDGTDLCDLSILRPVTFHAGFGSGEGGPNAMKVNKSAGK